MSLLNRIIGNKNRTANWPKKLTTPLVFSFDLLAIEQVPLGSDFDELQFLGPDSDPFSSKHEHQYKNLGISAYESENKKYFEHLTIYTTDYAGLIPFNGIFLLDDKEIPLDKSTTPKQIETLFTNWNIKINYDKKTHLPIDAVIEKNGRIFEPSWEETGQMIDLEIYRDHTGSLA